MRLRNEIDVGGILLVIPPTPVLRLTVEVNFFRLTGIAVMPSDSVDSIALTYRPRGGVRTHHEQMLRKYLVNNAAAWEFYLEVLDDDDSTAHLHGKVALKHTQRMDHVKRALVRALKAELDEKTVLRNGIKYLYDDWSYAAKDGNCVESLTYLPDDVVWQFADPANKTVKRKNARIQFHLDLIKTKLAGKQVAGVYPVSKDAVAPGLVWQDVYTALLPHVAAGTVDIGTPTGFQNLCRSILILHDAQERHGSQLLVPDGDVVDPESEAEMSD